MGKTARRSIDDSPSSPSNSSYLFNQQHQQQSQTTIAGQSLRTYIIKNNLQTTSSYGESSQIKNVENRSVSTAAPTSLSSTTSYTKTSNTASQSEKILATQKPSTTTYKAFTTTYKSSTSTRVYSYHNGRNETREAMRAEFYATYDVMTGIRIAATLGGFFFLMVFLIVYKSRSHSVKALKDPKIQERAAAAVQEEEDREMQEVFEKTAFSLYQDELELPPMPINFGLDRDRIASVGNVSCPPYLINSNLRFSSIGGYSTLLEPPRRYSDMGRNRRQSSTESSRILSAYHLNDNYSNQNENFFNESDCEEADDEFDQRFTTTAEIASYPHGLLSVPRGIDSRRSSGMTCCSTESSFLERRFSAITLGLSSLPPVSRNSSRRPSRETSWDYGDYHTAIAYPGIHIIEATPKSSPCPSERQSHLSGGSIKDHIKVLGRFKRRRHEDNSIDSISEYPDEISNNNNHHHHQQQQQQQQLNHSSDSRQLSENDVNLNSNIHQSKTSMSSNSKIEDNDDHTSHPNNKANTVAATVVPADSNRRAPLASLSSFKMSSIECADSANGSVFDESCADTDDDLEQFSTDSDEISLQSPPSTDQHIPSGSSTIKCDNSVIMKSSEIAGTLLTCDHPQNKFETIRSSSSCEIERQQRTNDKLSTIRPIISYDKIKINENIKNNNNIKINNNNNNRNINKKSSSTECVAINVVDYKNENSFIKLSAPRSSSAVILEMPILMTQDDDKQTTQQVEIQQQQSHLFETDDIAATFDPSLPGPSSRKWSKETLF